MRNFCFALLFGISLFCGCSEAVESNKLPELWSEAKVRNLLADRWSQGDTLPNFHENLLDFFPEPWEPFKRNAVKSSGIYEKAAFLSEAQSVYFQTDDGFVEVYLADYSADRGAFIRLIQKFEKIQENPQELQKVWPEDKEGVFAWEWIDRQSHLHYLEAGAFTRFHILIRTNLPEGKPNLAMAWQKLAWKKLRKLKPRP